MLLKRIIMDWYALSDVAAVQEIGRNLQLIRLNQDITQQELAVQTGLSRLTISQVENGRPASTLTLVQLLRALGRLDVLEVLEESATISPLQAARLARQQRQRASRRNEDASTTGL
ncbi:helix-turn-helix domain-containing protein [Hymenobacter monticola]|uniref:Helix-turn-helix domain-containing protein n=2 Tax=Hymenobacter TaxID=89966 RepID=A0ABY4BBJ8_9BACT|nr:MULTISPECIES: helix-turn-helix transcriptional regulator [Hymenobacter]MDU0372269.1 helix-turn-helix transcriptional regulator [Hymenobacter endophyticus]UOE36547.1 helix-turn-helix domain-containing protein [Hymenobacter monticola]